MNDNSKAVTVKLDFPIEYGTETIDVLHFRRMKAKDLKGMHLDSIGMDDIQRIVSSTTGHPPSVIGELDAVDFMKCADVVASFLPGGRTTGRTF